MDPEGKARLDIVAYASGLSVRLDLPGYGTGGKNPYDACVGAKLEDVPAIVGRQFVLMPNPHFVCALIACGKATGVGLSRYEETRLSLVLHGIALREHGLHLARCVRAGELKSGKAETDVLTTYAHEVAAAGMSLCGFFCDECRPPVLRSKYPGGVLPPHRYRTEKTDTSLRLYDARTGAVHLARAFASARNMSGEISAPRISKADGFWADANTVVSFGGRGGLDIAVESAEDLLSFQSTFVGPLARLSSGSLPERSTWDIGWAVGRLRSSALLAVAAECVTLIDLATSAINDLPEEPDIPEKSAAEPVAVALVEAPRGTLLHEVRAEGGRVASGRVVTPTALKLRVMEDSLTDVIRAMSGRERREEIERALTSELRAHYPCMDLCDESLECIWPDRD